MEPHRTSFLTERYKRAQALFSRGYPFLRIVVAFILLFAAYKKAEMLLTIPVAGSGLLGSRPFGICWVLFEVTCFVWLLADPAPRITRPGFILLFSLLAGVSAYKFAISEDCNCFGTAHLPRGFTPILDAVIVLLFFLCKPDRSEKKRYPRFSAAMGILLWILCSFLFLSALAKVQTNNRNLLGIELVAADGTQAVTLEPEKWVGKFCPLFSHLVNDATPLLKGEWIVVIGKQGCAECEALVRDFLPKHRNVALLVLKEGETAYTPPEGLGFYSEFEIEQTSVFLVPCAVRCLDGVCLELLEKEE